VLLVLTPTASPPVPLSHADGPRPAFQVPSKSSIKRRPRYTHSLFFFSFPPRLYFFRLKCDLDGHQLLTVRNVGFRNHHPPFRPLFGFLTLFPPPFSVRHIDFSLNSVRTCTCPTVFPASVILFPPFLCERCAYGSPLILFPGPPASIIACIYMEVCTPIPTEGVPPPPSMFWVGLSPTTFSQLVPFPGMMSPISNHHPLPPEVSL